MRNSVFIELYVQLNDRQRKDLSKLASSNYFSGKRNYTSILKYLRTVCRTANRTDEIISKLQIFTGLKRQAMWNRLSELTKIAENYLILEQLKSSQFLRQSILLECMKDKKAAKRYVNSALRQFKHERISSMYYYFSHLVHEHAAQFFFSEGVSHRFREYFSVHLEHQGTYFLMEELRQSINCLLQQKDNPGRYESFGTQMLYNDARTEQIIKEIQSTSPNIYRALKVYHSIYRAFREPKERKHYDEAKHILFDSSSLFDGHMKLELYQTLKDYCIDRTNSGDESFYEESFDLNNKILEEGLFDRLYAYSTNTNHFRNFIFAAIRLNRPKWVETFIDDYSGYLSEDIREDEISISKAILFIHAKQYSAALAQLNRVRRRNYLHYLDTSVYRSIVYYETNDIEECYKESARMKDYMRQHREIPLYLRSSYQRFEKKYEELLKLELRRDKNEIRRYVDEMESLKNIGMGNWLWQKARELL